MRNVFLGTIAVLLLSAMLAGCGETIHGVARDSRRIRNGVRTIFIRDN